MPESFQHVAIVERVLKYIQDEYQSITTLSTFTDLPGDTQTKRPPVIGGYMPDVFCTNTPSTLTIIGDAKTSKDLQTHRSLEQISTFFNHLTNTRSGHLAVGVPWHNEAFMVNFFSRLRAAAPDRFVKTSIVTELRVLKCY